MSIDLRTEELLSLAAAVRRLPRRSNGKRINVATVHRWATHGCKDVVLETSYVGAHKYTSVEALQRFMDARVAAEAGNQEAIVSRPRRRPRLRSKDAGRAAEAVSELLSTEAGP